MWHKEIFHPALKEHVELPGNDYEFVKNPHGAESYLVYLSNNDDK